MIDPELRESGLKVSDRMLRQFAGLWLIVFGTLATLQFFDGSHRRAAVFAVGATVVGLTGLVKPKAVRWLFLGATALAMPIGLVVSRVLLAMLFFGVFAPLALLFRLTGRDALARRRRPDRPTYWTVKQQPTDPDSYLRQT